VDVDVGNAGADRRDELGELARRDALARRPDDVGRRQRALDGRRGSQRTGLRTRRTVAQVRAQEDADAAVDPALAEVDVRLLHAALQRGVRELVGDRVAGRLDAGLEGAAAGGRDGRHLLVAREGLAYLLASARERGGARDGHRRGDRDRQGELDSNVHCTHLLCDGETADVPACSPYPAG
jgi:hypothetical protein